MSDDRRLAELVGEVLQPRPMDPARQVAFRRAVERRIRTARRSSVPWWSGFALAATAAASAALWFALSTPSPSEPIEIVREAPPAAAVPAAVTEEQEETTVLAGFADPDEILGDAEVSDDYLPDDYFVLASLVDELDG